MTKNFSFKSMSSKLMVVASVAAGLVLANPGMVAAKSVQADPPPVQDFVKSLIGWLESQVASWSSTTVTVTVRGSGTVTSTAPIQPATSSEVCRLQKVNTANEMAGIDSQRLEVGGHHVQHADFYPSKGIKSVSYIVTAITPPEVPMVWLGFGSIWEANDAASCGTFDWIDDATQYASARIDSGHSGLVVDMRSGSPVVVANVNNMSQVEIDKLLKIHEAAMNNTVTTTTTSATNVAQPATANSGTCKATRKDHTPVVGEAWTVAGPSIVNFWSNQPGVDQSEHKLLVPAGTTVNLLGGGAQYSFPAGCDMMTEFTANGLPEITIPELAKLGLK